MHISESSNFLNFVLFSFSLRFPYEDLPKSYQYPEVNRVVGQVAIETRQGRHASHDTVVVSLLKDENCSCWRDYLCYSQ